MVFREILLLNCTVILFNFKRQIVIFNCPTQEARGLRHGALVLCVLFMFNKDKHNYDHSRNKKATVGMSKHVGMSMGVTLLTAMLFLGMGTGPA